MSGLSVERVRFRGRLEPEPGERGTELVELLERGGAVARLDVHAHQHPAGSLVGRLLGDYLLPKPCSTKKLDVESAQMTPRFLCPVFVSLLRQQLAAVESRNVGADIRIAGSERGLGLRLEALGVDMKLGGRPQAHLILAEDDGLLRADRRPCVVRGLAQVGPTRLGRQLRPKRVHHLLALEPVPRGEREQFHELDRATVLPCPTRNEAPLDRDLEPAEDAYLDASHTSRMLAIAAVGKDHPADLVPREDVVDYPTDFAAMTQEELDRLALRGEQLTRLFIDRWCPEL